MTTHYLNVHTRCFTRAGLVVHSVCWTAEYYVSCEDDDGKPEGYGRRHCKAVLTGAEAGPLRTDSWYCGAA